MIITFNIFYYYFLTFQFLSRNSVKLLSFTSRTSGCSPASLNSRYCFCTAQQERRMSQKHQLHILPSSLFCVYKNAEGTYDCLAVFNDHICCNSMRHTTLLLSIRVRYIWAADKKPANHGCTMQIRQFDLCECKSFPGFCPGGTLVLF